MGWMWMATAFGQLVPHGHTVPETVRLHDDLRYVAAVGKARESTCDEALKAAWADLEKRLKPGEVVVAVWPKDGRTTWETTPDVECFSKGKNEVVEMDVLVSHPGPAPLYPEIPTTRLFALIEAWYGRAAGGMIFDMVKIREREGALWLDVRVGAVRSTDLGLGPSEVAALVLEERVIDELHRLAKRAEALPEAAGVEVGIAVDLVQGDKKLRHHVTVAVPAGPLKRYHSGKLGVRDLIAASAMTWQGPDGEPKGVRVAPEKIREKR